MNWYVILILIVLIAAIVSVIILPIFETFPSILISAIVGFASAFLLSQLNDYRKNKDITKKCKSHINFDLNGVLEAWINQFKIYTVYLRKFEDKTLWSVLQDKNLNPLKGINLTLSTSQFELIEVVKHSEFYH